MDLKLSMFSPGDHLKVMPYKHVSKNFQKDNDANVGKIFVCSRVLFVGKDGNTPVYLPREGHNLVFCTHDNYFCEDELMKVNEGLVDSIDKLRSHILSIDVFDPSYEPDSNSFGDFDTSVCAICRQKVEASCLAVNYNQRCHGYNDDFFLERLYVMHPKCIDRTINKENIMYVREITNHPFKFFKNDKVKCLINANQYHDPDTTNLECRILGGYWDLLKNTVEYCVAFDITLYEDREGYDINSTYVNQEDLVMVKKFERIPYIPEEEKPIESKYLV